jgi:hypothetical protein
MLNMGAIGGLISPGRSYCSNPRAQLLAPQASGRARWSSADGVKLMEAAERHGLEGYRFEAPGVALPLGAMP